jgi:hypothetical protein
MSNHSGSYMLNGVLMLMEEQSVFKLLGKEKTQILVRDIIKLSHQYDCNPGEILEDIGERVGICCYCEKPADELHDGLCKSCREPDKG